jgi:hypothetical protein
MSDAFVGLFLIVRKCMVQTEKKTAELLLYALSDKRLIRYDQVVVYRSIIFLRITIAF